MASVFKCDRCEDVWENRVLPGATVAFRRQPENQHSTVSRELCPTCADEIERLIKRKPVTEVAHA